MSIVKHSLLILLSLIIGVLSGSGKTLTADEALARFLNFKGNRLYSFNQNDLNPDGRNLKLKSEFNTFSDSPCIYLFEDINRADFYLLTADDNFPPLLGYSDNGRFDADNIPPAFSDLIAYYTAQIDYFQQNGHVAEISSPSPGELAGKYSPIAPLIKSKWDQFEPYNNKCPTVGGVHCATGCVAVAMAQVMNYYRYPEYGNGSVSYTSPTINQKLTLNLASDTFDWDNMLDEYVAGKYDAVQGEAVANLMKACGYAVHMDYGLDGSGAFNTDIPDCLRKKFRYDDGVSLINRENFSIEDWEGIIYSNLKDGCPVIYAGKPGNNSGHCFVCDGYDGNGYFHFNWGWSGYCDGYFLTDILNPTSSETVKLNEEYNAFQVAVVGIKPPEKKTESPLEIILEGNIEASVDNNKLSLKTTYYNIKTLPIHGIFLGSPEDFSLGLILENKETGNIDNIILLPEVSLSTVNSIWTYTNPIDISLLNLENNIDYKATLSRRNNEDNDDWIPVKTYNGCNSSFDISNINGKITIENYPVHIFEITDLIIPERLYIDELIPFTVNVRNNSSSSLSGSIGISFCNSKQEMKLFSNTFSNISLAPGETREIDLISEWGIKDPNDINLPTTLTGHLYDPQLNFDYDYPSFKVVISKESVKPEQIIIEEKSITIYVGDEAQLTGYVFPEEAYNKSIKWLTEDGTICTVQDGLVKGRKPGKTKIMAQTVNGLTDECEIEVLPILAASITLAENEITLYEGERYSLVASVLPENTTDKKVVWESEDRGIANVNESGVVTAVSYGNTRIKAMTANNLVDYCQISVFPKVEVELSVSDTILYEGEIYELTVITHPDGWENFIDWKSSDENIIRINGLNGNLYSGEEDLKNEKLYFTIETINSGSAIISASVFGWKETSLQVDVKEVFLTENIYIHPEYIHLIEGEQILLDVEVYPENITFPGLEWSSDNESVAIVDNKGLVTATGIGEAVISAKSTDGTDVEGKCYITGESSIKPIIDTKDGIDIYSADGILIKKKADFSMISNLPPGIYFISKNGEIFKIIRSHNPE